MGERLYGYLPIATRLVIEAGRVGARSLVEASPPRQSLAPVYNQYAQVSRDPSYRREDDAVQMLYRPLFTAAL